MIEVVRGSLVQQKVDAIVNAANTLMRGGGGIDGKIHQAAGPEMLRALQKAAPRGAAISEVIATRGFNLPARHVLHVAGPIWRGGTAGEPKLLEACYRNALLKADELGCESVGFCSISTGTYRYPLPDAARIAMSVMSSEISQRKHVNRVVFAMFLSEEFQVFQTALEDA